LLYQFIKAFVSFLATGKLDKTFIIVVFIVYDDGDDERVGSGWRARCTSAEAV